MLETFTLIAILLTLVPGISFFVKQQMHKQKMRDRAILDEEVNKWRDNRDPGKLKDAIDARMKVTNKIFSYQSDISRSNYFLAAGSCSFAIIELYKWISHYLG